MQEIFKVSIHNILAMHNMLNTALLKADIFFNYANIFSLVLQYYCKL